MAGPRESILLGCPRICPRWELSALSALLKPQLKDKIMHRRAQQAWPGDASVRVERVRLAVRERTGFDPALHLPPLGDYHLVAKAPQADLPLARALALALSVEFPGTWFVVGAHFACDCKFWRRERRSRPNLAPASSLHLPRPLRRRIADLLRAPADHERDKYERNINPDRDHRDPVAQ